MRFVGSKLLFGAMLLGLLLTAVATYLGFFQDGRPDLVSVGRLMMIVASIATMGLLAAYLTSDNKEAGDD